MKLFFVYCYVHIGVLMVYSETVIKLWLYAFWTSCINYSY